MRDGATILDADGNFAEYAKDYIAQQKRYTNSPATVCSSPGCPICFWTKGDTNSSQYGSLISTTAKITRARL